MGLVPYELEALQTDLQGFIINMRTFNNQYASLFNTLFVTGLRIGEITKQDRFIIKESPYFEIVTEKGSNNRIISSLELDSYFQYDYNLGRYPYTNTSSSVASYFMRRYMTKKTVYVGDKITTTHLFRHCLIKFLYSINWEVSQIAEFMGEKDNKNIIMYIDSQIFYVD